MTAQKQTTVSQPEQKNGHKIEPAIAAEPGLEWTDIATMAGTFTAASGSDPIETARWLDALLFAASVVPAGAAVWSVTGSALAAAAVAAAARRAAPHATGRALVALALVPLMLLPVYWRRNERWVRAADLSATVVEQVRRTSEVQPGRPIVIVDNPTERFNLDAAFGTLWPDAAALCLPGVNASIGSGAGAPAGGIVLRLAGGRLVQED